MCHRCDIFISCQCRLDLRDPLTGWYCAMVGIVVVVVIGYCLRLYVAHAERCSVYSQVGPDRVVVFKDGRLHPA